MKIVTAAEMREIDRRTSESFSVPSLTLMENAGTSVAEFVIERYPSARKVGIICGKGNNGGDGFVAARKLHEARREVHLILLADPGDLHGDAAEMFRKLPDPPVFVRSAEDLKGERAHAAFSSEVLVDAILGTGFRPPVTGLYAEAIAEINSSGAPVVAVDIPSGADADAMTPQTTLVARADGILTFTAPRPAHVFGMLSKGPVRVSPIGSPPDAIRSDLQLNVVTAPDIVSLFAPRRIDANKGSFGHVLVIGGSVGKAGAAAMAGMSALRSGAGLSTIATPRSVLSTVAHFHPEVMTEPLDETEGGSISLCALEYGRLDALVKGKTVLAIGPGISLNIETAEFVRSIVAKYTLPLVLDADGLNAFDGHAGKLNGRKRPLVITPHPGEMARLAGCSVKDVQQDRLGTARKFAHEHDLIVVLKGHQTLVVRPDGEAWVNTTGNPGMATGGTGDILTGIIAGVIAQSPDQVMVATLAAVHLHGLAGDIARETMGEQCLVATDLVKALPEAFRRMR
ncbi:MAG TPA: NAD(P)H-hydrate dehydratase, partial [Terriglobales bacterium]